MLNAAFTALCGLMLIGVAAWFLWELWSAVEPKPITDDFLRLLNDSFGRDWRNPLKWPWARVLWAYGFTVVGATLTAGVGVMIWTLVASSHATKAPTIRDRHVTELQAGPIAGPQPHPLASTPTGGHAPPSCDTTSPRGSLDGLTGTKRTLSSRRARTLVTARARIIQMAARTLGHSMPIQSRYR